MLRSLHRLDLTNRGAQGSPGAERKHDRSLCGQVRFQLPRGCTTQAEHSVLVGVTQVVSFVVGTLLGAWAAYRRNTRPARTPV